MITRRCTACLDDERCWVCLGTGLIDSRGGEPGPCHRCYASGACADCQTITIEDVGQSPILNPFRRWRVAPLRRTGSRASHGNRYRGLEIS